MSQKRSTQDHDYSAELSEAVRTVSETAAQKPAKTEEDKISVFWRVFGGTILSMVALGTVTMYNNISANIAEVRGDLNHEREIRLDLVKKEDLNARFTSQSERIRAFETLKAEFEGTKERVNANVAALDAMKKDTASGVETIKKEAVAASDAVKKDTAMIDVLKERVLALEAAKKEAVGLEVLKEKYAATVVELKQVRDEVTKIQHEQERNKQSDSERKASRDSQYKQVDESLKELQKGLQDCREKLARLEGARGMEQKGTSDSSPSKSVSTEK